MAETPAHRDDASARDTGTADEGVLTMPYLSKFHLPEQHAAALLGPVVAAVGELERRTRHHADRMVLADADRAALLAAEQALAAARETLERIKAGAR